MNCPANTITSIDILNTSLLVISCPDPKSNNKIFKNSQQFDKNV